MTPRTERIVHTIEDILFVPMMVVGALVFVACIALLWWYCCTDDAEKQRVPE